MSADAVAASQVPDEAYGTVGVREFRAQTIRVAISAIFGLAIGLLVIAAFGLNRVEPELFVVVVALALIAGAAHSAYRYRPAIASLCLVAGLPAILGVTLFLLPPSIVAPWMCLVVLAVSALGGWRWGAVVAVAASGTLFFALAHEVLSLPPESALSAVLLTWSGLFVSWMIAKPTQTALGWAWSSHLQTLSLIQEARDRQAELARLSKSLSESYYRLELLNLELERARRVAEEARRLKAQFAAAVSHELRTPLNLIIGFSEMMAMAPHIYGSERLPPAYQADAQAIHRNAKHLSNLIDDILDLSQIEVGRMGLIKEPVSLAEVIAEAVSAVAPLLEVKRLSLVVNAPEPLPPVQADRTRVRQVLINLLSNAARFTDRGGVTIAATSDGRNATIAVADTGIGIADEDIPKVFEEFRQLDATTRRQHGGSGLGLAISKKFVELHGGWMWATSQPGVGSTFSFTLPVREDSIVPERWAERPTWVRLTPTSTSMGTRMSNDEKTVVVDAEPTTIRLFQRYLDGYRVVPAPRGDEVRQRAAREPMYALVTIAPSSEVGWARLQQAREAAPNLPVVVCALAGGPGGAGPEGVTHYLVKPILADQFLAALSGLGPAVRSVLIVDDDPDVVRMLSRMIQLAPRPYRVIRAYGGAQALAVLDKRRPGAVVLDLLMPEVDGYTVLARMRAAERLRNVPVIVVTAKGKEEEVITAGLMGMTRHSGFSIGELTRWLKASLDSLSGPAELPAAPAPSARRPE